MNFGFIGAGTAKFKLCQQEMPHQHSIEMLCSSLLLGLISMTTEINLRAYWKGRSGLIYKWKIDVLKLNSLAILLLHQIVSLLNCSLIPLTCGYVGLKTLALKGEESVLRGALV